jgi:hypothetical protein
LVAARTGGGTGRPLPLSGCQQATSTTLKRSFPLKRRLLHVAPYSAHRTGSGGHARLAATRSRLNDWDVRDLYYEDETATIRSTPPRLWRSDRTVTLDRLARAAQVIALKAGFPVSDQFAVSSPELKAEVARRSAEHRADVALVEFSQLAPCRPPGVPSVLVIYDVLWMKLSSLASERARVGGSSLELRRLVAEIKVLRRMELREYSLFDHVVTVSEHEADALRSGWEERRLKGPAVTVSPNGIDWAAFGAVGAGGRPGTCAFVGGRDHPPNDDAIQCLIREVLPKLGSLEGLTLAGPGTDQFTGARIIGLGHVADVRDVYASVSFTVAPIRWGAGTKLKVLESMAAGRPVVAFPAAAEGLEPLVNSAGLIIETDLAGFISCVDRLAGNPREAAERGERARADVAGFDWDTTLAPLLAALDAVAAQPTTRGGGRSARIHR